MDKPCTNPECARLRLELQLAQEELQRIKSAGYDMLKQRGAWQSAGKMKTHKDLGLEFQDFFDHDAENTLEYLMGKSSSLAEEVVRRLLCEAFQITYEKCKEQILRKVEEVLNRILSIGGMTPDGDSSSEDLYDACRAYGLLLHASGLARSPQSQVSQEVCKEVLDEMTLADVGAPSENEMSKFVSSACHLSWNLLTTVPPLVCAQPNTAFCKECHQKELTPLWNNEIESYELVYYRPVLFLNYDGKVAREGWVGNKRCNSPSATASKKDDDDQTKDAQHPVQTDDKDTRRVTHSEQPTAIAIAPKQLPALLSPSTQAEPTPSSSAKQSQGKVRSKLPSEIGLPQKCQLHSGERAVKTHKELLKAMEAVALSDRTTAVGHSGGSGVASKPSKVHFGTRKEDKQSQETEPNTPGKYSYTPLWLWK